MGFSLMIRMTGIHHLCGIVPKCIDPSANATVLWMLQRNTNALRLLQRHRSKRTHYAGLTDIGAALSSSHVVTFSRDLSEGQMNTFGSLTELLRLRMVAGAES